MFDNLDVYFQMDLDLNMTAYPWESKTLYTLRLIEQWFLPFLWLFAIYFAFSLSRTFLVHKNLRILLVSLLKLGIAFYSVHFNHSLTSNKCFQATIISQKQLQQIALLFLVFVRTVNISFNDVP